MRWVGQAVLMLCAVVCFTGCGQKQGGDGEATVTLGLSYDSLESAWLVMNHKAVVEEAEKRGAKIVSVMAEGDAAKQNVQIENLIARRVDAILCFPKDSAAIVKSVKNCKSAGVPIVMINRPVSGDILPDAQVIANNQEMAKAVLQTFADRARKEGKIYNVVLLIGNLSDENAALRPHHRAAGRPDHRDPGRRRFYARRSDPMHGGSRNDAGLSLDREGGLRRRPSRGT